MVRRIFLACLIGVLTLLQAVAPLIHAHAGEGGITHGGLHLDGVARLAPHSAPGASGDIDALQPDEGAAVSPGPELRDRLLLPVLVPALVSFVPCPDGRLVPFASEPPETRGLSESLRPPSRAPPVERVT